MYLIVPEGGGSDSVITISAWFWLLVVLRNENATEEETTVAAANDNQATEPKTIVQDELTPASSQSVIIRRGDTLWQIARRTYGAGVRYTTIYLANQQQIENPDKIAPGQIFEVPEEALENAEQLHRQRLGLE